jgi:glycosyltransferase involved in cell wall biosynthesis
VNQPLAQTFAKLNSNTRFIPDGIEPAILDRPFVVGWAGRDTDFRYKGVELIMQAVSSLQRDGLNVRLEIATSRSPSEMPSFYRSIDLYVCASEAEGFSTPVMEALAMGLPVLSTRVGVPYFSMLEHAQWCDRTVESIASEIAKAYAARRLIVGLDETLAQFRWSVIAKRFIEFFEETFERWDKRE